MWYLKVALLGSLCLVLLSCQRTFDNLNDFEAYVTDAEGPFVQSIVRNGVRLEARLIPTDAMLLRHYERLATIDTKSAGSVSDSVRESELAQLELKRQAYDRSVYFALRIGLEDETKDIIFESSHAQVHGYSKLLNSLMFNLNDKISLRDGRGHEVPLDTYHFERTFGLEKSRTILLAFPAEMGDQPNKRISPLSLVVEEFGLETGRVRLEFDQLDSARKYELRIN